MRLLVAGIAVVLMACGSVSERQACAVSTDCPLGEFCAHEGGERFCWPDASAPLVGALTASCAPAPCERDAVMRVEASVTDDEEVLGATVALGLGGPEVSMERVGDTWVADVPLREQPFEAFERGVTVTVTARDGARNEGAAALPGVTITRLRWERTVDSTPALDLSPPAVMPDGTVVLGGSNARLYFIAADGSDARPSLLVGAGRISAAPAVGERAIWIGSEDFSLYGVKLDGTGLLAGALLNTGGPVRGSLAIRSEATREWAFGASESRRLGAVSTGGDPAQLTGATDVYTAGPVIDLGGKIHAATATATATATLRSHTFDGAFTAGWTASIGVNVSAPLAVDGAGNVWTGSQDGKLHRTRPDGSSNAIATLPGSVVGSPVVLPNGDLVVGDQSGALHRFDASDASVWATSPNLGAPVLSPMVLAGGNATLVVPTTAGTVHALRDDGSEAWSRTLASGVALRAGNLHTPAGQPAPVMSTAYFSASNGKLYAVVVDGELDGAAPWPKAFHDPRNTNRAGPQP